MRSPSPEARPTSGGAQPARNATLLDLPRIDDACKVAPQDARELSKLFFQRLRALEEGTHAYQYARNTLIELNLTLVNFVASRFRHRAEPMDDIVQVGTIGLIKAIDRFDLDREVEFTSFAVPYIVGEIKRFFRDTSWAVRVPRRLQELRIELAKAGEELSRGLGRAPTTEELAEFTGATVDEVIEGRIASNGYVAGSLDVPVGDDGRDASLADQLGDLDPALEKVENLQALKPLVEGLDERDRRILRMRFGGDMTQSEIGAELGISQMHVSRLLSRALTRLREGLLTQQ